MRFSRRALITAAIVGGAARAVHAQPSRAPAIIGFLSERALPPQYLDALRKGLVARGWSEGQQFRIEVRSADGDLERLPGLVANLVGLGVGVIVTGLGTPVALAAKKATAAIPIVFVTGGDPVQFGIVSNAAKPGGNITGYGGGIAVIRRRIDLLREVVPRVRQVAFLRNLANPIHPRILKTTEEVGGSLGLAIHEIGVFEATELDDAFARIRDKRLGGLFVPGDAMFSTHRARLVDLAARTRLPTVYGDRVLVDGGGLMSVSVDLVDLCGRAADHVDKILRGTRAGDLPVEEARKFELVVNSKAAKGLGLTIPKRVLERAEVVGS
jgi:putative ABC transport system substrate-binding protein